MEETIVQEIDGDQIDKIRNATFRASDFVETFFVCPWNHNEKLILTPSQRDAIDCVQFGFPLSEFDFGEVEVLPHGVIMIWPRQRGKSTAVSAAAAALALMFPNSGIGMIGSAEDVALLLIDKVRDLIEHSIFKDKIIKDKATQITLSNGSWIKTHTCSVKSIRGHTYKWLFCDEVRWMEEEVLFEAALPTVLHGERWIMLTSPKGRRLKFMDYYYKGLETRPVICKNCGQHYTQHDFNVTNFPINEIPEELHACVLCGGEEYKYGMGIFAVPWVDSWNTPLFTKEEIKRLLDEHDWSPWAKQEYLGMILDEASMVFLQEWIDAACGFGAEDLLRNVIKKRDRVRYIMGVDYGKKHDASCFCVTHWDKRRGKVVVDYIEKIAGEFDVETSYQAIRERLIHIAKAFNVAMIVPDATGLGDPLVEELERDLRKAGLRCKIYDNTKGGRGFIISRKSKPELIGELITRFRAKPIQIELPPSTEPLIDDLIKELLNYECEVDSATMYVKYGTQQWHDDMVVALALSSWPHRLPVWTPPRVRMFNYA